MLDAVQYIVERIIFGALVMAMNGVVEFKVAVRLGQSTLIADAVDLFLNPANASAASNWEPMVSLSVRSTDKELARSA